MNYNRLFEHNGPDFYVIGLAAEEVMPLRRDLAQAIPAATVRVIRGDKSTNEEAFFNEAGAALQFPGDFVELWENFAACLDDLSWLPGEPRLLLFSYAPYLLCDEPPAVFGELIEQLAKTAKSRSKGQFKMLFQVAPDDMTAFLDRLENAGANYTLLTD
jgi:hypothetical protein